MDENWMFEQILCEVVASPLTEHNIGMVLCLLGEYIRKQDVWGKVGIPKSNTPMNITEEVNVKVIEKRLECNSSLAW